MKPYRERIIVGLIIAAVLIPVMLISQKCNGQKILQDEIDKFTKQRRIETSLANFKWGLFESICAYIRSVDTSCYIILKGTGSSADVIGDKDEAIFLLDNDSTVTIYSTGIQTYDINVESPNSFHHQYSTTIFDIMKLSQHNLKSIRKYGTGGYIDIDIPKKHQDELRKISTLFLKEFNR